MRSVRRISNSMLYRISSSFLYRIHPARQQKKPTDARQRPRPATAPGDSDRGRGSTNAAEAGVVIYNVRPKKLQIAKPKSLMDINLSCRCPDAASPTWLK